MVLQSFGLSLRPFKQLPVAMSTTHVLSVQLHGGASKISIGRKIKYCIHKKNGFDKKTNF
jgi:hypothetical protein